MGDLDRNGYSRAAAAHQRVLNQKWPPNPRTFRDQPPTPITARLVFEHDGQQVLDGHAVRWDRTHVCVTVEDPRLQIVYVWLDPADVRRR